jgi:predicted dehydrogenase
MNEFLGTRIPAFTNPGKLYEKAKPGLVVIATVDRTHLEYIQGAFQAQVNSIVEKPLCINAEQCRRILAFQKAGKGITAVTAHNYRYAPDMLYLKQLLEENKIGKLRSIIFHEYLDLRHGASYFRRWNRRKKDSGGLVVHKASHCFDLMNWFTGAKAKTLFARGALNVYGNRASRFQGEKCHTCKHTKQCPHYVDYASDLKKSQADLRTRLYFSDKSADRYTPDLCVFSSEIDIEDYITVGYDYDNGVQVTFELCAYSSYEGVFIGLEGTKGRLEYQLMTGTKPGKNNADKYGSEITNLQSLRFYKFDGGMQAVEMPKREDQAHGGADWRMLKDLLGKPPHSKAAATLEEGVQAVLIGAAANASMATGRVVDVQALLKANKRDF